MKRYALAWGLVCLVGITGASAQEPTLAQAERQLVAEDTAAARQTAEGLSSADGDAEIQRLWLLALSHMREDAPRAALPHLERLVTLAPDTARFRLELARALYLIEDNERAYHHFQFALGGSLSLSEIATVHEYLHAMERRKPWQGHARVAVVSQSNPWHRSGEDFVDIGGKLLLPVPEVESATGLEIGLGATHLPRLSRDLHARLHLMATGQIFEKSDLNRWHLRGEMGLLSLGDHGRQIGGGVSLQAAYGASGRIMHGVGIYASFQQRFGDRTRLAMRMTADQLSYRGLPQLGGPRITTAMELSRIVSPQLRLQGGVQLAHHHTEAAFHRRSTGAVSLGGEYALRGGMIAGLEARYTHIRVAEANPLQLQYGPERSNRMGITARLMHRDYTMRGFAPVLIMGYERQSSNVPRQSFDNLRVSLGATRNF